MQIVTGRIFLKRIPLIGKKLSFFGFRIRKFYKTSQSPWNIHRIDIIKHEKNIIWVNTFDKGGKHGSLFVHLDSV